MALCAPSTICELGAVADTFANQSFLVELENPSARVPIDFRIADVGDARMITMLEEIRRVSNWTSRRNQANQTEATKREGTGVSVARLKLGCSHLAAVCRVTLDMESGKTRLTRVKHQTRYQSRSIFTSGLGGPSAD